jgi:hypothetical protein
MEPEDVLVRRIAEHLPRIQFIFARTYARTAPHEYFLQHQDPETFELIKQLIGGYGYEETFWGRPYRYADLGEHKYWILGMVCNRAPRENS